jgi:hypothetical protein
MSETMGWSSDGRVSVTVHGPSTPSASEWQAYVNHIRSFPDLRGRRVLVLSHGGGPDALQRKALGEANRVAGPATLAIVTDNRVMRAVAAALAPFNPLIRCFAPSELKRALAYLDLTPSEQSAALHIAAALELRLGLESITKRHAL